jgi:hypothetical protein
MPAIDPARILCADTVACPILQTRSPDLIRKTMTAVDSTMGGTAHRKQCKHAGLSF